MKTLNLYSLDQYPAQIIIMRHTEKPSIGPNLSELGVEHSRLLPQFFENSRILNEFGKPIAIFSAAPVKEGRSMRCIQTMIPLAMHFQLQINQTYTKKDDADLVESILDNSAFMNQTVFICWPRDGIPKMARLFGVNDCPAYWPADVFNELWVIKIGKERPYLKRLKWF